MGITQPLQASKYFVSLTMVEFWQLEIQNRLHSGPVIGFSVYPRDEEYSEGEWILYLGLFSIHLKYW